MTPDQKKYYGLRRKIAAGQTLLNQDIKNLALTVDGHLCVGMTLNRTWGHYGSWAIETNGVREIRREEWDLNGRSLTGFSDLDMTTISKGVNTV